MRLIHHKFVLIGLVLFGLSAIHPGPNAASDDESLWLTALEKYEKGHYGDAVIDLQGIIQTPYTNYGSSALLLLAKCYLHEGMPEDVAQSAEDLISKYPESRYVAYAHYLLAQVSFLHKEYFESAWQMLVAAQTTQDDDLNLLARAKLAGIFEDFLDRDEQNVLLKWVKDRDIQLELTSIQQGFRPPLKIGVIMELSGPNAASGESLLAGVEAALRRDRSSIPHEVSLITRDSGGNVKEAIQAAQALIQEEDVVALIGDLSGSCSAAIAAVASEHQVPLIIPAAQDKGLSRIGKSIIQLMPDYHWEGAVAAAYARFDLGAEKATVLAPASEAARQRVEGFTAEFENFGGEIVLVQWYYLEATSYKRQLEQLVQIGAERLGEEYKLSKAEINALIAWDEQENSGSETAAQIQGGGDDGLVDSLLQAYVSPINYFDVMYIPVEGQEISLLTPQIAASGFDRTLLGDANCQDFITAESDWRYVDGIKFPANFPASKDIGHESEFFNSPESSMGEVLNHFNILGVDAFDFLAETLKVPGRVNSRLLVKRLQGTSSFKGERMNMEFPKGERMNQALYILKFENGEFHEIKSPHDVVEAYLR